MDQISRKKAAEIVKVWCWYRYRHNNQGHRFVIVGNVGAGPVKIKKIKEYNAAGSDIKMIYEREFLKW